MLVQSLLVSIAARLAISMHMPAEAFYLVAANAYDMHLRDDERKGAATSPSATATDSKAAAYGHAPARKPC
jgi:hypothetical protein